MPFIVPLASMSRRTVSNCVEQVLAVVHAVGVDAAGAAAGSATPGPFGGERPMGDAEVARLGAECVMPRRLTNGGMSFGLAAAELATSPSRTTGGAAVRLAFSL